MNTRMSTVVVALLCLALAGAALGMDGRQTRKDYALIYGTVWTAQGHPAAGVKVKIRRADEKKWRWELMADSNGEFAQRVPPGKADYVIAADIKMPRGKPQPTVTAHVENDERVDIGLHLTE